MKVLLLGSKGFLGQYFLRAYPNAICPSVDIADASAVAVTLDEHSPDIVINCAARTGRPNVDWCEDHQEETLRSNVTGPLVLLSECGSRGIYWMQMGSGCIFEGDNGGRGFSEEDEPNFAGSFYSQSKLWIDQILRMFPVLLLRPRMPFDGTDNPRSLITKVRKYDRVLDMPNSITYIPDMIDAAVALIEKRATGVYHVVNPGTTSPYEIMMKYQEIVDPNHTFERITQEQLLEMTKAGRSNCILNSDKLAAEGITMRPVEEAVELALTELKGHLAPVG